MKLIDVDALVKYAWSNPDIEVDGDPYISPYTVQNFAIDHPITVDSQNEPLTIEQLRQGSTPKESYINYCMNCGAKIDN